MEAKIRVYCDTNTLPGNAGNSATESEALKQLQSDERLTWFTSHIVRHEAMKTRDEGKRSMLVGEHEARTPIPNDEKVVGFNAQSSQHGFVGFFLLADVQDEALRAELIARGLDQRDAEHSRRGGRVSTSLAFRPRRRNALRLSRPTSPFLCLRQSRPHPCQFHWRHRRCIGISQRSCVNFFIGHCHDLRPIRFIVGRKVIAAVAHDFGRTVLVHVARPYGQL